MAPASCSQSGYSSFLFHSCLHPELWAASSMCVGTPRPCIQNPFTTSLSIEFVHPPMDIHTNSSFRRLDLEKSALALEVGFEPFGQGILVSLLPRQGSSEGCGPDGHDQDAPQVTMVSLYLMRRCTSGGGPEWGSLKPGAKGKGKGSWV